MPAMSSHLFCHFDSKIEATIESRLTYHLPAKKRIGTPQLWKRFVRVELKLSEDGAPHMMRRVDRRKRGRVVGS